jgi:hypothetical protein
MRGLVDLLPLASDGGSRDFAVDVVGRNGSLTGTILLLDRGRMTEGSLQPVAADVVEFVELARGRSNKNADADARRQPVDASCTPSKTMGCSSSSSDNNEVVTIHATSEQMGRNIP